jgi:predicted RNase H-like HicB family nuclease
MTEIIFEVREDETDGGYNATALGFGIHTEAETIDELRANVREAVDCYFEEGQSSSRLICLKVS